MGGVKGLKKMIKKIQKSGKKKKKREKRFKKVLKKLAKAAGDSDSKKSNRRIKAIKAIIGKEAGEGGKKSSSKKIKKLLKKLDKKQKKSKKKQGKFLKKLIKREAKKEVRKTRSRSGGSEADHHREAGKTFLDWLRMKKGSNSKMREWVKAKLDAQEAGNKPRTKVSKKAMKKCMYRKDYRYGGEKMGTSKQEKVEGCCNKCDSTSGCRAWSWDRKSKVCTLISKVDKTGESSTCCIAGRRKKKLVK